MLVCLSPNGGSVFRGDEPARRLVIATIDGVTLADRHGSSFAPSGARLSGVHVSSVIREPHSGTLYAGAHSHGLFRSYDEGETWEEVGSTFADIEVYTVAALPRRDGGSALYVGTEPGGIFRSDDDGASWTELTALVELPNVDKWTFPAPPHEGHVKNITSHPSDPDVVYASVEQGGLFRSRDRGDTWEELESVVFADDEVYKDIHRLIIEPSSPRHLWITGGDGMSFSADGGASFQRLTGRGFRIGYPDALVFSPDESEVYVAGGRHSPGHWRHEPVADARVARSRDGGKTWTILENGLPELFVANIEAMSVGAFDDRFEIFFGTTDGDVYRSGDHGDTWEKILDGIPPVSKGDHYRPLSHASS